VESDYGYVENEHTFNQSKWKLGMSKVASEKASSDGQKTQVIRGPHPNLQSIFLVDVLLVAALAFSYAPYPQSFSRRLA